MAIAETAPTGPTMGKSATQGKQLLTLSTTIHRYLVPFDGSDLDENITAVGRRKYLMLLCSLLWIRKICMQSTLSNSNSPGIVKMFELQKMRITEIRIIEVSF